MIESTPVSTLKGVGKIAERAFARLGIKTVADLLEHYPVDYDDFTKTATLQTGLEDEVAVYAGEISQLKARPSLKRRGLIITTAVFSDSTGECEVVWFGRFAIKAPVATPVVLIGALNHKTGRLQLDNPVWELVGSKKSLAGKLVPRYSLSAGLTQSVVRSAVQQALDNINIEDSLPTSVVVKYNLLDRTTALRNIHFPENIKLKEQARDRLAFEEMFILQMAQLVHRQQNKQLSSWPLNNDDKLVSSTVAALPFELTASQLASVNTILKDMARDFPMNRLLQGDVGSGKTAVAAVAAGVVVKQGYQVLYLAPTEILARQQFLSLQKLLPSIQLVLLTRGSQVSTLGHSTKQEVLAAVKSEKIDIIVGTHAVLNDLVAVPKLLLVVVDEQHRFGVEQRLRAQKLTKDMAPHVLSMTATPIPRTLQLAFYGDVDLLTLHESPFGKRDIVTYVVPPQQREIIENRLRLHLDKGEQVYVVCPLIEDSEAIDAKAAESEYERLRLGPLKGYEVGFLHGRMETEAKQAILEKFRAGQIKVLVATTVVEVGIDVPAATTIIIEGAERFGLAQLHQLRGRVGRAGQRGYCLLFTNSVSQKASERLQKFATTNDGFALSELDLELRGPGEWFGVAQSGFSDLKLANLTDHLLLTNANEATSDILETDPELKKLPEIKRRIVKMIKLANQA